MLEPRKATSPTLVTLALASAIALLLGCSSDAEPPASPNATIDASGASDDASLTDAASVGDAALAASDGDAGERGRPDAGSTDASADAPSAGPHGDILGTLTGECGNLAARLMDPSPSLAKNDLVFVPGEVWAAASLSAGGARLYSTPNAGGSSFESEVMSYEVLRHCEDAALLKTETEIRYAVSGTITDILVGIGGKKVGVSVTRAYKPANMSYPDSEVRALIQRKLDGIVASSANVAPEDRWVKQILHVFTANRSATEAVLRVYPGLPAATRADTILLLTQTTGGGFVYCNPDPPLGSECP